MSRNYAKLDLTRNEKFTVNLFFSEIEKMILSNEYEHLIFKLNNFHKNVRIQTLRKSVLSRFKCVEVFSNNVDIVVVKTHINFDVLTIDINNIINNDNSLIL